MSFSQYQELALYHPRAGFYAERPGAGRTGDFITSPELGGLFGAVMVRALDRWWRQLNRPDPFYVIEAGAGGGALASTIVEAEPRFLSALRYVTVERSAELRAAQTGRLPIQPSSAGVGALYLDNGPGKGPVVVSLTDLPEGQFVGVVLANELLDNLPVNIYQRRGRHWLQVCVGLDRHEGGLVETLLPVEEEVDRHLRRLLLNAADGSRIPLQAEAVSWLQRALDLVFRGRVVVIDYMRTSRWMSHHPSEDWLRTYRNQRHGGSALEAPGSQDITCEVAVDQLGAVRPPDRDRSQAEFLEANGLDDLVADARQAWHARAAIGDLGAMRARSRVQESRALTDPNGLGRFRVLEWEIPPPKR